jgi:UDP-N-acetylmuramyl tripeptide synthase
VWAARESDTVIWVSVGWSWAADGKVCPNCGHPLHRGRSGRPDGAADWACSACGLRRPKPDASVIGDELVLSNGSVARLALRLPGRANQANAALAVMAAGQLGVPLVEGLAAMREVGEIEGRYAERSIVGRRCRLLLAKNPAGWAATMDLVGANGRPLLLSVNAADQDGRDTSWLYDVPFEQVRGRPVIVTGAAGVDLSLRLGYAGVLHRHVVDKRQAIRAIGVQAEQYGRSSDPIEVIGDYSSFQQLRRLAATT